MHYDIVHGAFRMNQTTGRSYTRKGDRKPIFYKAKPEVQHSSLEISPYKNEASDILNDKSLRNTSEFNEKRRSSMA